MKISRSMMILALSALVLTAVADDDLLGSKRGGGNKGGSPSRSSGGSQERNAPSRDRDASSRDRGNRGSAQNSQPRNDQNISSRAGRSGRSQYGTTNNRTNRGQSGREDDARIRARADRQDNSRPQYDNNNRRNGYYHYDPRWRDDNFSYSYYQFDYRSGCRPSPFYGYPSLPAYVDNRRTSRWNDNDYDCEWRWDDYCWSYQDRYNRDDCYRLNCAIRDLCRTYQRHDYWALDAIIDGNVRVRIQVGSNDPYGVRGDDFFDLIYDGVNNCRTRSVQVESVRVSGPYVRVRLRHEWSDPWNHTCRSYHEYTMRDDGRHYVTVDFRTD